MNRRFQVAAFVLILVMSVIGCNDSDDTSFTSPAGVSVAPGSFELGNFWVGRGQNKFGVYTEENLLQVTVPAGAYLLTYTTVQGGTFHIVFSSEEGAFLAIQLLDGDTLKDVYVYPGEISGDPPPVPEMVVEGVSIFVWPGSETGIQWDDVFIVNEVLTVIVLVINGEVNTDAAEEIPKTSPPEKFEILTNVLDTGECGEIGPEGPIQAPQGSSRSFKFHRCDGGNFLAGGGRVWVNGIEVTAQVQGLGNGDGHLVIHNIQEDILLEAEF